MNKSEGSPSPKADPRPHSKDPASQDKEFAYNMKRIRELLGWSQGELARKVTDLGVDGFHQTTISRIEKGERLVRLGEASNIARALGRPVDHLLLPYREIEPIEAFEELGRQAPTLRFRVSDAIKNYESWWNELDAQVRKFKPLRDTTTDKVRKYELFKLIQRAETALLYRLDNIEEWRDIPRREMPRYRERSQNGEHPEAS